MCFLSTDFSLSLIHIYYDPETGRFVNADSVDVLLIEQENNIEHNIFVYCLNNPMKYNDDSGEFAVTLTALAGGILLLGTMLIFTAIRSTIKSYYATKYEPNP